MRQFTLQKECNKSSSSIPTHFPYLMIRWYAKLRQCVFIESSLRIAASKNKDNNMRVCYKIFRRLF